MLEGNLNKTDRIFNASSSIPKRRQEALKFNGWGYKDSKFSVTQDNKIKFTGSRYEIINNKFLTNFNEWMDRTLGIKLNFELLNIPKQIKFDNDSIINSVENKMLMIEIKKLKLDFSTDAEDRIFRSHGHTMEEIYVLRTGKFQRVPDIVIWSHSHDEVVTIIDLSSKYDAVVIPFGGGTSVTGSLMCSENENRFIISLDTSQMNRILWVNENNLTARMEAGIIGQDMEDRLGLLGYCVGHEPDSIEFSSLGGWVATRASGMKKNMYGNIEDLLIHVTMVTPKGVIQKEYQVPRTSSGPDIHEIILGSEGTLGVITEVTLKIKRLPKYRKYTSIVFPDFESGFHYLHEIAQKQLYPASIRLMDNEQFHFGLALKVSEGSIFSRFFDDLKKVYLLKFKRFDPFELCVATILMEGESQRIVSEQEKQLMEIATKFKGISGGEQNGKRGYLLTFVIAYIRDLALDNFVAAESFETSVAWDRVLDVCASVKSRAVSESKKMGITKPVLITCRITQIYDAGVCIYFYLAINYSEFSSADPSFNPVPMYEHLETVLRNEILENGGSLSHHHGVGKIRKRWLSRVISPTGMLALRSLKNCLDPKNLFANASLFDENLNAKL